MTSMCVLSPSFPSKDSDSQSLPSDDIFNKAFTWIALILKFPLKYTESKIKDNS